ncbi:MAG: tyrosinase family protein [Pseudomonadota bacterium]
MDIAGFEDVKDLLNNLQGSTVPDYQGHRAFWQDYDTLLTASVYGQRLIAPDLNSTGKSANGKSGCCASSSGSGDCWPSGGNTRHATPHHDDSRSARSALIIGLRGEAPFDHSIYPPLLWDAARKPTAEEIRLIADWIDHGCPREKPQLSESHRVQRVESSRQQRLAAGEEKHQASDICTNVLRKDHKALRVRKEVSSLTDTEVQRLRDAITCMRTFDEHWQDERSFNFWARMHANSCQHGWEQFLPWHRLYLYFFEQKLQDYDEHITLPYWAWSNYYEQNLTTLNNSEPDLGYVPERYGCWIDIAAVDNLRKISTEDGGFTSAELDQLAVMARAGTVYQSGSRFLKAAGIPYALFKGEDGSAQWVPKIKALYEQLQRINPLWLPQRWPGSMGQASSARYPSANDIELLLQTPHWADFGGGPEADHHFGHLEQIHNGMHNFSGGVNPDFPGNGNPSFQKLYKDLGLSNDPQAIDNPQYGLMVDNRVTAFDPLFWAHHSNVDRLWWLWQKRHPHANPEVLDAALAPFSMTVQEALSTSKLGYEYLRNSFHYQVSSSQAMVRFNSAPAGVDAATLDSFTGADIRLHRVQSADLPNAVIRVFLNQDNADADTPTIDNPYFAGELQTFHGSCYGGPGHCNLPLDRTRSFDHRGLQHKEPRNYRVNATDSVRRVLQAGATDISVHLVVVGLDGAPIDNALYFEGVSLNFTD